jgi:hypothetical protein
MAEGWRVFWAGCEGAPAMRQHPGAWTSLDWSVAVSEFTGPVAGVDYSARLAGLRSWFPTDVDCVDYFEWLRWSGGFVCPGCGGDAWAARFGRSVALSGVLVARVGDGGNDLPRH